MEILKFLLDQDESVCRTASKNRRTPLHTAGEISLDFFI